MKELLKMLKNAESNLLEFRKQIVEIPKSKYFKLYATRTETSLAIEEARQGVRDSLSIKFDVLENIQRKATIMMSDTSYEQREELIKRYNDGI